MAKILMDIRNINTIDVIMAINSDFIFEHAV